jgi:hypothetical protein
VAAIVAGTVVVGSAVFVGAASPVGDGVADTVGDGRPPIPAVGSNTTVSGVGSITTVRSVMTKKLRPNNTAATAITPTAEGRIIGRQMILYASALIPVSLLPTPLGLTGSIYLVGALALGGTLLGFAAVAREGMSRRAVRRVFLGSLAYQPLLLALMLVDTVRL